MAQTRSPVATTIVYNLTGQTDFTVPFEYLARKYVELTLLGITRQPLVMNSDYRFVSKTVVSLNVNPGAGFTQLEIRRNTSATERLVDFHDGSILRANDLNISQIQSLHVAEEARSNVSDAISIDDDGNLDARNRKIVNLLGGTADTDAVNYGQLRQFDNSTLINAARAEQARFAAEAAAATAQAAGTGNVSQLLTKAVTLWKAGEVIDYPNARRLFNGQEYVGQIITDQPHTCAATFAEDSAFWTLSNLQPATAGYRRMSYWKWMLRNGNALNIACFGDSTMWGASIGNLGTQDPNNAPTSLGKALSLLYGVNNNIVNRAISGTTLRQMLEGTDGSGAPFEYHVSQGSAQNAHIIYCNHGINDSQLLGDVGQYRKDLFEFVQTVRRWGKTPCLVTPNPNPSIVLINETKGKNLESFVSVMREVAAELNVDLVDQFYWFNRTANTIGMNSIVPDGAHLSSRGYLQAGANLAIPLVSCRTLNKEGDIATMTNTSWFSNSNNRQLQGETNRYPRFGTGLYMEQEPSLTGLNFPYILGDYRETLALTGLHWSNAANIVVSDSMGGRGGNYNVRWGRGFGSTNAVPSNWETSANFNLEQWAGLNIVGLLFNTASYDPAKTGLVFCGVSIPELSGAAYYFGGAYDPVLAQYQTIVAPGVEITEGKSISFYDMEGLAAHNKVLDVKLEGGTMTFNMYSHGTAVLTHTVGSGSGGVYDVRITTGPATTTILAGSVSHTFQHADRGSVPAFRCEPGRHVFFTEHKGNLAY